MTKKQNNNDEQEIIDSIDSKLTKLSNNAKLLIGNIADKIGEIPGLAGNILTSSDKSEANYNELAKQDKKVIEMIIKQKLESSNLSDEELKDLLDRNERITERSEGFVGNLKIVGYSVATSFCLM